MFARGNWAIFSIDPASLGDFRTSLQDRYRMLAYSQLTARAVAKLGSLDTTGINPFGAPRLDEKLDLDFEQTERLCQMLNRYHAESRGEDGPSYPVDAYESGFASGVDTFSLVPEGAEPSKWFGLWVVFNDGKPTNDPASLKEQLSYINLERPYRFLDATDKKAIDVATTEETATVRKQSAVLVDFSGGRLYIENTNKNSLIAATNLLGKLGVRVQAAQWAFGTEPDWVARIASRYLGNTHFLGTFQERAREVSKFQLGGDLVAKLDDTEMERILQKFFSMTQTDDGLWAGLAAPAKVRLHPNMDAIAVTHPTMATTLLGVTDDADVCSAQIVIQDRIGTFSKSTGKERFWRKDLVTFALDGQMNQAEAGAALLRGFDLPGFRKSILRSIKKTGQVPSVQEFWRRWLTAMNDAVYLISGQLRDALDLSGDQPGGLMVVDAEPGGAGLEVEDCK